MASRSILLASGGGGEQQQRRTRSAGAEARLASKPSPAPAFRQFQLSHPTRAGCHARCCRHLRPNQRFSENVPTIFKSWQTAANGQSSLRYSLTWRQRSPCGGEHRGQVSSCRHFSAAQRVPTASGQNGGAQPLPHACHRDVVRTRNRERRARRRGLTSLWCDGNLQWLGKPGYPEKLSGSGAELQGILTP